MTGCMYLCLTVSVPVVVIDVDVLPSYVVATAVGIESSYCGCGWIAS